MSEIRIELDGRAGVFPAGSSYLDIIHELFPNRSRPALAAMSDGALRALADRPEWDGSARVLDYRDDEGRRVYERSLRLMFLAAADEECPDAKVWIEHSVHYGVFARLSVPIDRYTVARIERKMRGWAAADVPFRREVLDAQALLDMLAKQPDDAAFRLLSAHPPREAAVYSIGEKENAYYLFGELAPSAGVIKSFELEPYSSGVIIRLPQRRDAAKPDAFRYQPKYMRTFKEAARWAKILNCCNIADLNDMVHSGSIRDFVWISEALHEKSIADIADRIVSRGARAILVAGPSSSGKTTFTHRLAIQLRVLGKRPVIMSLDNYYRDREDIPVEPDGSRDLESLDAFNVSLLNGQLDALMAGETVTIPDYSFTRGCSKPGDSVRLDGDQPLLIEGIHGLNPQIAANLPAEMRFRIYISALTALNLDPHNRLRTTDIRLIRRIVRDHQFRSSTIEHTLSMWPSVRAGEEKWIFPYQESADVSFNSALPYELTVLKGKAQPMLVDVPPNSPHRPVAMRLSRLLEYVDEADVERDISPTSILREFIGGCAFYMRAV